MLIKQRPAVCSALFNLGSIFFLILVMIPSVSQAVNRLVPSQYSTIQAAITASSSGDVVLVSDGTYNVQVTVNKSGITLRSANQYGARIDGAGTRIGIYAPSGTNDVTIDGFEISNVLDGIIMEKNGNFDGWMIENNKIHHIWQRGILASGIGGSSNPRHTIRNNIIYIACCHQEATGIKVESRATLVSGNQIHTIAKDGIRVGGQNSLVKDNIVFNANVCLNSNTARGGNEMYNNYAYDCNEGLAIKHSRCIDGQNNFYEQVFHNTFHDLMDDAFDIGINEPPTQCIRFKNNVMSIGDYGGVKAISERVEYTSNIDIDGNMYNVGSGNYLYTQSQTSPTVGYTTLTALRNNTPYADNGVVADPRITNKQEGIYYEVGSPVFNGSLNQTSSGYGTQLGAHGLTQTVDKIEYEPNITAVNASTQTGTMNRLTDLRDDRRWNPNVQSGWVVLRLNNGNDSTFRYFTYYSLNKNIGPIKTFTLEKGESSTGPWTQIFNGTSDKTDTQGGRNFYEMSSDVTTKFLRFNFLSTWHGDNAVISQMRVFNIVPQNISPPVPPPDQDIFYVDTSCGANGDGTTQVCATAGAEGCTTHGPWNSLKNALETAGCAGMTSGNYLVVKGDTSHDPTCENGGSCYFEDTIIVSPNCSNIIVQNEENEHVQANGTTDISGSSWTSIGSGVYECQTSGCSGPVGNTFAFTAWYDRGAGEERLNLVQTNQVCDTSLAAGFMRIDESDQSICVHLSDGSSPATASYFRVPTYTSFLRANTGSASNITIRNNPIGTGSFNVGRYRVSGIELNPATNTGWQILGLNLDWMMHRCIDVGGTDGSAGTKINDNTISYCGSEAIRLDNDLAIFEVYDNTITNIQQEPEFERCEAIGTDCLTGFFNNAVGVRIQNFDGVGGVVSGNTILNVGGGNDGRAIGINLVGHTSGNLIEKNYVAHMSGLAREGVAYSIVSATSGDTQDGNTLINNRAHDVDIGFHQDYSGTLGTQMGTVNYFINNTISEPLQDGIRAEFSGSAVLDGSMVIQNNVLSSISGSPPNTLLSVQSGSTGWTTLQNNAFECDDCTTDQDIVNWKGTTFERDGDCTSSTDCIDDMPTVLGASYSGNDYGNINLSLTGGEPTLQLSSPSIAIDTGQTVALVSTDYQGAARPFNGVYDIGAHEFTGAAPASGTIRQKSYRFYGRFLPEGFNPIAPSNMLFVGYIKSQFSLRFAIVADGGDVGSTNFVLYARKCTPSCGAWAAVDLDTAATVGVYIVDNPERPNRELLTNKLNLGGYSFKSGGLYIDGDVEPVLLSINENQQIEVEYSLSMSSNIAKGDSVEFRIEQSGGTDLDTYSFTPSIVVGNPKMVLRGGVYSGGIYE